MVFQKKIRFFLRYFLAIFKKKGKSILLGVLLGVSFYLFIPDLIKIIPKPRKIQKIGIVGQFETSEIPEKILDQISLGLTSLTEKGEILPSLAEKWIATDEGKIYTFKLKSKKLTWHDDSDFLPSDVNYNFKDVSMTVNGLDIEFKLKESFSPFPFVVSKPIFKKGLIGLGEYKISRIEKNGKYIKSLNLTPVNNKNLPKKIYKFYINDEQIKLAFNLGEINAIEESLDIEGLNLGKNSIVSEKMMTNVYLGIFFDLSSPPFSEKTFRQALSYAILKEALPKRALGPLNPNSWAYNPDVKPYEQDLNKAESLLEKEKEALKETKIVLSTLPRYEEFARTIKSSWEKLGIQVEIQVFSFVPNEFQALLIAMEIPKEPDQYYYWHSTQGGNITKLNNPRIDKLLEDGRKIVDREVRKDIYYDFQRFLVEESPVVFLFHPTYFNIER